MKRTFYNLNVCYFSQRWLDFVWGNLANIWHAPFYPIHILYWMQNIARSCHYVTYKCWSPVKPTNHCFLTYLVRTSSTHYKHWLPVLCVVDCSSRGVTCCVTGTCWPSPTLATWPSSRTTRWRRDCRNTQPNLAGMRTVVWTLVAIVGHTGIIGAG